MPKASLPANTKPHTAKRQRKNGKSKAATAPATLVQDDAKPFPFMELPRELRNRIYAFVYTHPGGTLIIEGRLRRKAGDSSALVGRISKPQSEQIKASMNLLYASRQVNAEATPYLYGTNTFEVDTMSVLRVFLRDIGEARCHLESIVVGGSYVAAPATMCFVLLSQAKHIRSLQLRQAWHWDVAADDFFRVLKIFTNSIAKYRGDRAAGLRAIHWLDNSVVPGNRLWSDDQAAFVAKLELLNETQ